MVAIGEIEIVYLHKWLIKSVLALYGNPVQTNYVATAVKIDL